MVFEFNGETWDTAKPVFVAGCGIGKSWTPFDVQNREASRNQYFKYGITCHKGFISDVRFKLYPDNAEVEGFSVYVPKKLDYQRTFYSRGSLIGLSSDSVMSHQRQKAVQKFLDEFISGGNNDG